MAYGANIMSHCAGTKEGLPVPKLIQACCHTLSFEPASVPVERVKCLARLATFLIVPTAAPANAA